MKSDMMVLPIPKTICAGAGRYSDQYQSSRLVPSLSSLTLLSNLPTVHHKLMPNVLPAGMDQYTKDDSAELDSLLHGRSHNMPNRKS
jgi:hypothetical protein